MANDEVTKDVSATDKGAGNATTSGKEVKAGGDVNPNGGEVASTKEVSAADSLFGEGSEDVEDKKDATEDSSSDSVEDSDAGAKDSDDDFDEAAPDREVPEKPFEGDVGEGYKLKLVPGLSKDSPELQGFLKSIKGADVKPEKAQALFDMFVENRKQAAKHVIELDKQYRENLNAQWIKENKSDPVFGRENYEASVNYVQAALRKFVPKEELIGDPKNPSKINFMQLLKEGNIKNCPPWFRAWARVGKYISEAGPVTTMATAKTNKTEENISYADALFGGEFGGQK